MVDSEKYISGLTEYNDSVSELNSRFDTKVKDLSDTAREIYRSGVTPVYRQSARYAIDHDERKLFFASKNVNEDCVKAIDRLVNDNFDGMHLGIKTGESLYREFGEERVTLILAATIQYKDYDGRFSYKNQEWANSIQLPDSFVDILPDRRPKTDYVSDVHPALLDGFVSIVRKELETRVLEEAQKKETEDKDMPMNAENEYKDFAEKIKGEFQKQLDARGEDYTAVVGMRTAQHDSPLGERMDYVINLRRPGSSTLGVGVKSMYDRYEHGQTMESIVSQAMAAFKAEKTYDWGCAKDNVELGVFCYSRNRDSIAGGMPHKRMGDICAYYRVPLETTEDKAVIAAKVTGDMLEKWGISLEELHEQAVKNTMERHPLDGERMEELMAKMLGQPVSAVPTPEMEMLVLKTKDMEEYAYGAATLFYPNVMDYMAKLCPEGAQILPSSIHEVIVMPQTEFSPSIKEAEELIQFVNQTEVAPEEVLSDRLHFFDAKKMEIGLATDYLKEKENIEQTRTADQPRRL